MRLAIRTTGKAGAQSGRNVEVVDLDSGTDLSQRVAAVDIRMRPHEVVTAKIEVFPDVVAVVGDRRESLRPDLGPRYSQAKEISYRLIHEGRIAWGLREGRRPLLPGEVGVA